MAVAILYRDELREYDFGPGHSFRGDRYVDFHRFLTEQLPEDSNYRIVEADWANDDDLLLICEQEYIAFTTEYYRAANLGLDHPGSFSRFHSGDNIPTGRPGRLEEAARLVVGLAKKACDLVLEGEFRKAICIGGGLHHAKPGYGEGFCLYNDVAFCGRYLRNEHGLDRILILDTDAHAGNGTSAYFYEDGSVLLIDLHQDPQTLYPGTGFAHQIGSGDGKGFNINIPMPPFSGYDSYRLVFEEVVLPVAKEFQPDIIIRNGGSDPHFRDGLTNLGLPLEGFRMIGEKVREMAEACQGKAIDLIASGYNRDILPYGWLALISGLAGWDTTIEEASPIPEDPAVAKTESVVEEVRTQLRDFWSCLS
ncbi:MAG: histone deacetylase family protein [Dehalococcoidia bacterium]